MKKTDKGRSYLLQQNYLDMWYRWGDPSQPITAYTSFLPWNKNMLVLKQTYQTSLHNIFLFKTLCRYLKVNFTLCGGLQVKTTVIKTLAISGKEDAKINVQMLLQSKVVVQSPKQILQYFPAVNAWHSLYCNLLIGIRFYNQGSKMTKTKNKHQQIIPINHL